VVGGGWWVVGGGGGWPQSEEEARDYQGVFRQVLALLAGELAQPNATVRKNIKDLLHQIADLTGTDLTTLLEPLKQSILGTSSLP
jgi:hypothetical protein